MSGRNHIGWNNSGRDTADGDNANEDITDGDNADGMLQVRTLMEETIQVRMIQMGSLLETIQVREDTAGRHAADGDDTREHTTGGWHTVQVGGLKLRYTHRWLRPTL